MEEEKKKTTISLTVSAWRCSGGTGPSLGGDGSARAPAAGSDPARRCGSGWGWCVSPWLLTGVRMKPMEAVGRARRSTGDGLGSSPGSASRATRSLPLSQGNCPSLWCPTSAGPGGLLEDPCLSHPLHPTLPQAAATGASQTTFDMFNLLLKKKILKKVGFLRSLLWETLL